MAASTTPRALTVYFDDDCGICSYAIQSIIAADRQGRIEFIGTSEPAQFKHHLSNVDLTRTIVVYDNRTGQRFIESRAFAAIAREMPPVYQPLRLIALPGLRVVMDLGYRQVAKNRAWLSARLGLTTCRVGPRRA